MAKLQGKIALITGSGRGIGREVALKLASEGASIVVNDLDSAPADETVAAITAAGGKAVACIGSVTAVDFAERSEEHTSELQSLMRISYAVFCLKKKTKQHFPLRI